MSHNHWSTLTTCQEFVNDILHPYWNGVKARLHLPSNQKMVWLLDCWSVHKSEAFLSWIKLEYPWICVLFIPANCTSKLQPADVILQRPLKAGFTMHFKQWSASSIQCQIQNGAPQIQLDLTIGTLREHLCTWLLESWKDVGDRREMIVRGWEKCGLTRPFERSFQAEAMEANTLGLLFDSKDNSSIEEELIHDAELEELFEDEDIAELMAKCIM